MRTRSFFAPHFAIVAAAALTGSLALAPTAQATDEKTSAANSPEETLQIVVSLNKQQLQLYRGEEVIYSSHVSSGKPGHSTPTGIFSILEKRRHHRSNIYSNSPMPYMQRLTWSGVALHESHSVPNYPASHGCVRMPRKNAAEMFQLTHVGLPVVVSHEAIAPRPIVDTNLPQPALSRSYDPTLDQWRVLVDNAGVRLTKNFAHKVSTAALLYPVRDKLGFNRKPSGEPLRVLITRRSQREITASVQQLLNRLGYEAGPVDGLAGVATAAAVKAFQTEHEMDENGVITPEFTKALYAEAGQTQPENAQVYVRRKFEMLFDAPITIDEPEKPLGTHLLTATRYDADKLKTDWLAMTMDNQLPKVTRAYFNIDEAASDETAVHEALARINIPQDVALKIARMLTPGSTITISDTGLSQTGWKTDFRVFTKPGRKA